MTSGRARVRGIADRWVKEHVMRRTSIVAAAGIAALTLGSGIAAATPTGTQTVTIEVGTAPMSLTVGGEAPSFSVALGATLVDETSSASTLSFRNPQSQVAVANISVERSSTALGALILGVSLADAVDHTPAVEATWTAADQTSKPLATAIALGTDASDVDLTWTLTGTAPAAAASIVTDFTYTISQ
jgi:hypothetical protein